MAADSKALGGLHTKVAQVLTSLLEDQKRDVFDKEGKCVGTEVITPSPALIAVAVTFLKNNNITADPDTNDELKATTEALRQRREARQKRQMALDPDAAPPLLN